MQQLKHYHQEKNTLRLPFESSDILIRLEFTTSEVFVYHISEDWGVLEPHLPQSQNGEAWTWRK